VTTTGVPRQRRSEVRGALPDPHRVLIGSVAACCVIGLLTVYSASQVLAVEQGESVWYFVVRQLLWLAVGVAALLVVSRIPLEVWRKQLVWLLLGFSTLPLAYISVSELSRRVGGPILPLVLSRNGSTRWLGVDAVQFQPSELAKLALVVCLARLLSEPGRDLSTRRGLLAPLGVAGFLGVLVMIGDDLGTTVLLGVILLGLLLVAGAPGRVLVAIVGLLAGVAVLAVRFLEGFRAARLAAFLDPEAYADGAGYQIIQSQIGLATGGLFGLGPGSSRNKWGYLPEAHTDFVVSVIGEEYGLLGAIAVVVLIGVIVLSGMAIARHSATQFGRLLAVGITVWLGVQALINVAVTVGLVPTKGITLPFISYGGSSLVVSFIGFGLLLRVASERPTGR
jgi:cell division protein FtsW